MVASGRGRWAVSQKRRMIPKTCEFVMKVLLFFVQDKDAVRAAAFTLFGKLSRFGGGPSKAPFLEQVHTNLISVLLHLNEEDDVIKVTGVTS